MSERIQYPTVADTRAALEQIIAAAVEASEYTGLYEAVYADDISEELVGVLEHIAALARGAAKRQAASHERVAEFADSVNADLDQLEVTAADPGEDHDRWLEDWRRAVEEDDE